MPSCTTHFIHSNEVYSNLKDEVKKEIDTNKLIYNAFAQSHDYFYYSFNKEAKKLGSRGHHRNTRDFLINIINYIKDNNLQSHKELVCCLYGYITHYVLDTTCHPFIFYKTGVYRHDKETKKYKGLHSKMENDIDALYYERYYHMSYKKFSVARKIIGRPKLTPELCKLIDYAYELYDHKNTSKYLKRCFRNARIINHLTTKDRLGLKLPFFKLYDLITKDHVASYSNHHKPTIDYLNNEHKTWVNPCYDNITSNKSFDDLFEDAIKKAVLIIETTYNYLNNNTDISTLDIIENLDYSSGLDLKIDKRMDYFEF